MDQTLGKSHVHRVCRINAKQSAVATSARTEPHDVYRPPSACLEQVNTKEGSEDRGSAFVSPLSHAVRLLLGLQHKRWRPGRGLQSCHSPLSDIGKIEEVLGMQAPHRDGGACPEQAILLLGVDAQHAAALPGVRVLQARLDSWSNVVTRNNHGEQSAMIKHCCWQQERQPLPAAIQDPLDPITTITTSSEACMGIVWQICPIMGLSKHAANK